MLLTDRYVLKEVIPPIFLGFAVYSFALLMNSLLELANLLITKGASPATVLKIIYLLVLSSLPITIPMSLLMGVLAGISRLSSDNEIIAFRALGVSTWKLLRPVVFLSLLVFAINFYTNMYLTPRANKALARTLYDLVLTQTERQIKPHSFFEQIPKITIYVEEKSRGLWRNLLVYIEGRKEKLIVAKRGIFVVKKKERKAYFYFEDGEIHSFDRVRPHKYYLSSFRTAVENINPSLVFPRVRIGEKPVEKELPSLLRAIKEEKRPSRRRRYLMELHSRFALSFACLLFGILALPLGIFTRKGGSSFGFSMSIVIIIIYYIFYSAGRSFAEQGKIPIFLGFWIPNLGILLALLFAFRRSEGRLRRPKKMGPTVGPVLAFPSRREVVFELPRLFFRFPATLDRYLMVMLLKVFFFSFSVLYVVSALITFFELIDDVFEYKRSITVLFTYLFYFSPQITMYILPVSLLLAVLITFSLLHRSNEVMAIKAGGVSLYRASAPLILAGLLASFVAFTIQEKVLPYSNQRAEAVESYIKNRTPRTYYRFNRRWVFGKGDKVFHYLHFDWERGVFRNIQIFWLDRKNFRLRKRLFAREAFWKKGTWYLRGVWFRDFEKGEGKFVQADLMKLDLEETPSYFVREIKTPDEMTIKELSAYIKELERDGFNVTKLKVELESKRAFPFANFVMLLIALPFAFLFGRRGTAIGIGLSLALAAIYWVMLGMFKSLGGAGLLPPVLSAWGANVIFILIALILFSTIRT